MCIGYKKAIAADIPLLAQMNHGLIRDEGSENTMDIPKLAARMEVFLAGKYTALLLLRDADIIGYCLYRNEDPERPETASISGSIISCRHTGGRGWANRYL